MLERNGCIVCEFPTNTRVLRLKGLKGEITSQVGWLLCSPACAYQLKTTLGLQNTPPHRLDAVNRH